MSSLLALFVLSCGDAGSAPSTQSDAAYDSADVQESELALHDKAHWKLIGEELPPAMDVQLDPWLPSVVYASSSNGIFVSWSFGERWGRAQLVGQAHGVVVDPNRPGTALAYSDKELFETRDAGLSWHRLAVTLPAPLLAVAPGNAHVLWAGGVPRFYRSSDRGASWTALDFGGPGGCCLDFVALSATDIYASAYYAQLQRSLDGGESWSLNTFASLYMVPSFAVDRHHPDVVYAGNAVPYGPTGLRKSIDGGRTWTTPSTQLASARVSSLALSSVDGRLYAVTTSEHDPSVLQISRDGGSTFTAATPDDFAGASVREVFPHPSWPCLAYAATGEHLYRTASGGGTCP